MKKYVLLIALLTLFLGACQDETVREVKFEDLKLTESKTSMEVAYYSLSGEKVEKISQLLPNTEYTLKITSEAPVRLMFRMTDGFVMYPLSAEVSNLRTDNAYKIKTGGSEVKGLFFSAIPVRRNESGNLMKERAQLFLTELQEE